MPEQNLRVDDPSYDATTGRARMKEGTGRPSAAPSCFGWWIPVPFLWRPVSALVVPPADDPCTDSDDDTDDDEQQQQDPHASSTVLDAMIPSVGSSLVVLDTTTCTTAATPLADATDTVAAAATSCYCNSCDQPIRREWRFCAHCGMYLEHTTRRAAVLLLCDTTTNGDCADNNEEEDLLFEGYTLETPRDVAAPLVTTMMEGKPTIQQTRKEDCMRMLPTVSSPEDTTTSEGSTSDESNTSSSLSFGLGIDSHNDSFHCVQDELLGDLE